MRVRLDGQSRPLPLLVEVVPAIGFGKADPVRMEASQVIIRSPHGSVLAVASNFGAENSYAISHINDQDFQTILNALGIQQELSVVKIPPTEKGRFLLK